MTELRKTIDYAALGATLKGLFPIQTVLSFDFVHGGYMSQNFKVDTDKGTFFLKQYRNRINTVIHEIKEGEAFFASRGLPVILPIEDKYGRGAFWHRGHWFSLFPFVYGQSPVAGRMSSELIRDLSRTLAQLHREGQAFTQRPFQSLQLATPRKFHLQKTELMRILSSLTHKTLLEERFVEVLQLKEGYIKRLTYLPEHLSLSYNQLLHGDYQYYNVFAEGDSITHIYDLERVCLGPTEYEVARSLMLNCFDDGWRPENFERARVYLNEYRAHHPLTLKGLKEGMRLYTYNILNTTWIEARYLIFGIDTQLDLFNRHVDRLNFCAHQDMEMFCNQIYNEK
jgi:Ser/Thr protein kinase RdoA (MazF antagonist)